MPEPIFIDATPGTVGYTFGGRDPIATIRPGELVHLRTFDCFGGKVTSVSDLPSKVCQFPYLNPVTGPLWVEGARPGDTLAVHVVDLAPAAEVGWSATFPHFGALTGTPTTAMLHPALEERVWQYAIDVDAGTVGYTARGGDYTADLSLEPMLGTIGVAPAAGEVRLSIVPGPHGGNLDTPLIAAGTTVYLPVGAEGALLAVGDGHARQGDGELCGVAVEVPMDVVLCVEVIPDVVTRLPRLETDTRLISIGIARPLDDAYRSAHADLIAHLCELTGLDLLDAYQLVSQDGMARIGNMVDAQYTITADLDKRLLKGVQAYRGAHERLSLVGGLW
ncbi:acetamidase/formamidase family protein [Paractinoplanes brasiliensis]|uniref:Acetamidase/formamidase n=1 Tax=Paractinoplanes brasiliensis TaxID=52695 RepID=A0A4V3C7V5_9ACTN|nr:acetamidase/formamidase family protein [Actinoplanes brasiliensis]TDO39018.1 acetamidase/formamidase [Actinoplanes brasiliensis]GID30282.1 amidase [Actinoplanes brasiliensis]